MVVHPIHWPSASPATLAGAGALLIAHIVRCAGCRAMLVTVPGTELMTRVEGLVQQPFSVPCDNQTMFGYPVNVAVVPRNIGAVLGPCTHREMQARVPQVDAVIVDPLARVGAECNSVITRDVGGDECAVSAIRYHSCDPRRAWALLRGAC